MAFDESISDTLAARAAQDSAAKNTPIDGRVQITFDPDGSLANMTLFPPKNGGRPITKQAVLDELALNGITTGIDEFDISDMIKEEVYETPVCVARMIPPKRGDNGSVAYRYSKTPKLKPKQDEFGVANYRELDTIVPIRKGDIIADITLPTEGEEGTNIFGKPLPASPGVPAKYSVGKNTGVSADGKSIVALVDGHIYYKNNSFVVEDTVTIKSDLDISVGNIDFFGDIRIRGNVLEGFAINAGRNVTIDGSVFGSTITAGGNVTIVSGAINANIKAEGNVSIGFCENAQITAKGNVSSKQFAFCEVFCYGAVSTTGPRGVITGGKITSMHDVAAAVIGSEKYTPTEINIGDGSVLFARKRQCETELAEITEMLEMNCRNLNFLRQRKAMQNGLLTDAQQKQVKTETQAKLYNTMRKKDLAKLIAQLEDDINHKDRLSARVTGRIYPGARFCINFLTLEITDVCDRCTVTIIDDKLTVIPN